MDGGTRGLMGDSMEVRMGFHGCVDEGTMTPISARDQE